jgi:two-component system sensor histidine kinase QseC
MFQPTLVRRVFIAILLAFSVIWLAVVAFQYEIDTNENDLRNGIGSFMRYEMTGLQEANTEAEAYQYAISLEREFNRGRRFDGRPDALMELTDRHGKRLLEMTEHPLQGRLGQVLPLRLDGRDYLLFRGETALWTFQVAYPVQSFWDVAHGFGSEVVLRLLIAFPLILLPIWFAVARGLRPLRSLSTIIAARHENDLSPVNFDATYGELKPVVSAIDRLLIQLRTRIARERSFVQDAAHELRTPLAVVSAHVHGLARAVTEQDKLEAEQHVGNAIARASHLIQQLLELARVDGNPVEQVSLLDASHLTRQALAQAAPFAKARQIELSLEAPDSLLHPLEMHTFHSILHNLLDNAIRYIHPGGKIMVELKQTATTLLLSVTDDGPGIAEEDRSTVFERFYRGRAHDLPGSGLGLAIVQQAALRMDGEVLLSDGLSGRGDQRGCKFIVNIPAQA